MVSNATVAQVLQGIDFPKDKQELIDYAQQSDYPQEGPKQDVISALQRIPERQYLNMADLWVEVGKVE